MHEDGLEEGKDKEQDDELGDNAGCVGRARGRASDPTALDGTAYYHAQTQRKVDGWLHMHEAVERPTQRRPRGVTRKS